MGIGDDAAPRGWWWRRAGLVLLQGGMVAGAGVRAGGPPPAAVSFVTTEHFTLQGARAATIAEATGRATMFLGAVAGVPVAVAVLAWLQRIQAGAWARASAARLLADE
jgi:hypothetical protein